MKKFRDLTIKNKLTIIIMLASTAAVFFMGLSTAGFSYFISRKSLAHDLAGLSNIIGNNCSASIVFNIPEDAERILSALIEKPTIISAEIFDSNNKVFASYYKEDIGLSPHAAEQQMDGCFFNDDSLIVVSSILVNEDNIGRIVIADNMNDIRDRVRLDANILGMVVVVALFAAFIISARLQNLISKPILSLAKTASRVSSQRDFSIRAEKESEDEIGIFIDSFNDMISQIQQRDDELLQSSESLKDAQALSHIGNWEINLQTGVAVWSDETFRLLGFDPGAVTPSRDLFVSFIHPDDLGGYYQEAKNMGSDPSEIEFRVVLKDGITRDMYTRTVMEHDDSGELFKVRGVLQDITERKKAESEREWLAAILKSTSDLVSTSSPEGRITYMNAAGRRMLGWKDDENLETKLMTETHPEWAAKLVFEEGIPAAVRDGVWTGETALLRSDSAEIPVSQVIMSHKNKGGVLEYLSTIMRDVTERQKAEKEMNRLRNYLKNIIDSMPSVLISVDGEGKITNWNVEAEKASGIRPADAEGKMLSDIFPQLSSEVEKVREAMATRETRKDQKMENMINGEKRYSDVTIYPLIANGVEGAVIRVDDVTDRVRIEEMMVQSEKMLSVGGLAAGMAHEINNPLAGILQNVQVIRNRISPDLAKNRKVAEECGTTIEGITAYMEKREFPEMIEAVMDSGRRAAKIVENMLSFSRKGDSRHERKDLGELLDNTVMLVSNDYDLKQHYDFKKINIVREYENDAEVLCEGSKVQQVFLNILKNGAQAMMKKEEVALDLKFVLRVKHDEDMVRVEIEDNGEGMEEDVRKRVFEPFFTTKEVGVGTGLGLSVSYFIITDDHGGTMECESEPGKGTKFIIKLRRFNA